MPLMPNAPAALPTNRTAPPAVDSGLPTLNAHESGLIARYLHRAVVKTRRMSDYHIELTASATGGGEKDSWNRLVGSFRGSSSEYSIWGDAGEALSIGADRPLHLLNADGRSFLRGPLPTLGAPEPRWYEVSSEPIDAPLDAGIILDRLSFEQLSGASFSIFIQRGPLGVESSQFRADARGALYLVNAINAPEGEPLDRPALEELPLSSSIFELWVSPAGHLSRLHVDIEMDEGDGSPTTFRLDIQWSALPDGKPLRSPHLAIPLVRD